MQSTHDWYLPDSARVVDGLAQTARIIVHNSRCGRAQRHALEPSLASVLPKHIAVALKSRGRGRGLGGGGWTASAWSSALGRSACRCKWPSLVAACLHITDHYASETNTVSSQHASHTASKLQELIKHKKLQCSHECVCARTWRRAPLASLAGRVCRTACFLSGQSNRESID